MKSWNKLNVNLLQESLNFHFICIDNRQKMMLGYIEGEKKKLDVSNESDRLFDLNRKYVWSVRNIDEI